MKILFVALLHELLPILHDRIAMQHTDGSTTRCCVICGKHWRKP